MSTVDKQWHYISKEYTSAAESLHRSLIAIISNFKTMEIFVGCLSNQTLYLLEDFINEIKKFELIYIDKIIELHESIRGINITLLISCKAKVEPVIVNEKITNRWFNQNGELDDDNNDVTNMSVANEFSDTKNTTKRPYACQIKTSVFQQSKKLLTKVQSCHKFAHPAKNAHVTPLHEITNTFGGKSLNLHRPSMKHSKTLFK